MKKLFFSLVMSFILLFAVWFIIGFMYYGNDIFTKHLDVKATFDKLNLFDKWGVSGDLFRRTLATFRNHIIGWSKGGILSSILNMVGLEQKSTGFIIVLTAIEGLFRPLYAIAQSLLVSGYVFVMSLEIGYIFLSITLGIGEFILEPVFV